MSQEKSPLPEPEQKPAGITVDQLFDYFPEKIELSHGIIPCSHAGFYLAILRNWGLINAAIKVGWEKWLETLEIILLRRKKTNPNDIVLKQAIAKLKALVEKLES